jgi:uncharacterized protein (DUF58 family)
MGQGARKVVVVLDTSASMKAQDVSPSRFEAARAGAASLVRGLGEGAEVMVIEAGVQPKVTAALARDRERALGAISRGAAPRPADPARRSGADGARPRRRATRAPRSTCSPTAPSPAQSEDTTDARVRVDRRRRAGQERRDHEPLRSARTTTAPSTTRRSSRS